MIDVPKRLSTYGSLASYLISPHSGSITCEYYYKKLSVRYTVRQKFIKSKFLHQ